MIDAVLTLTTANFNDTVADIDRPLLVDFWAEWCGPCMMIAPILTEIATEHRKSLAVGKVNVDESPELASQFEVMSVPTLLVIYEGQVMKRLVGAKSKRLLVQELESLIAAGGSE